MYSPEGLSRRSRDNGFVVVVFLDAGGIRYKQPVKVSHQPEVPRVGEKGGNEEVSGSNSLSLTVKEK